MLISYEPAVAAGMVISITSALTYLTVKLPNVVLETVVVELKPVPLIRAVPPAVETLVIPVVVIAGSTFFLFGAKKKSWVFCLVLGCTSQMTSSANSILHQRE